MCSDYSYQSNPECGEASTRIKINKLNLQEKQKILLLYDFGDDWEITINVEKITQVEKSIEPHVTKKKEK